MGLARRFAGENRRQIACLVDEVVSTAGVGRLNWAEAITTDHNHVEHETHEAVRLWIHRKGAMQAWSGQSGVLPGSMGWYDFRQSDRLRDEAPGAYKDIRAVARTQRNLVKVARVLRPVLNYKGT
jgi:RNA-splicing ligase RtcB